MKAELESKISLVQLAKYADFDYKYCMEEF
jgi:hypothetical protein